MAKKVIYWKILTTLAVLLCLVQTFLLWHAEILWNDEHVARQACDDLFNDTH